MGAPLIERKSSVMICEEYGEHTWAKSTPHTFQASATTANTITSAALGTGNAWDHLGNLIEIVDGTGAGQIVQVRQFDAANSKITVDDFATTPAVLATCRMWTPPWAICRASSAGANTTIIASNRTEADANAWADPDRYQAVCIESAGSIVRGEAKTVTAFTPGTDTITVNSAFTAASAAGDLFELWCPVAPASMEVTLPTEEHAYISRDYVRGDCMQDAGVLGPRGGSLEMALELKGCSASSTGSTAAVEPTESRGPLYALFGAPDRDATSSIATGTNTTTFTVGGGEGSRFGADEMVLVSGEAAMVTAVATDTLTVTPALSQTPTLAAGVYGGVNWQPIETGFGSLSVCYYLGGSVRHILSGWTPSLKITGLVPPEIPKLALSGPIDTYFTNDVAIPHTLSYDSKIPRPVRPARVLIGGTAYAVASVEIDYGHRFEPQSDLNYAQGRQRFHFVGRNTTGTVRLWMENNDWREKFEQGTKHSLLVQVGADPGDTIAVYADQIEITSAPIAKEGGAYVYDLAFKVIRPSTSGLTKDIVLSMF